LDFSLEILAAYTAKTVFLPFQPVTELEAELIDLFVGGRRESVELFQQFLILLLEIADFGVEQRLSLLVLCYFGLELSYPGVQGI
jgi:hypothetical protein